MLIASALAIVGGGVVLVFAVATALRSGRWREIEPAAPRRVFSDRKTRLATLGYLDTCGSYAVWTWIAASPRLRRDRPRGWKQRRLRWRSDRSAPSTIGSGATRSAAAWRFG
jgi:hypothetical protein